MPGAEGAPQGCGNVVSSTTVATMGTTAHRLLWRSRYADQRTQNAGRRDPNLVVAGVQVEGVTAGETAQQSTRSRR